MNREELINSIRKGGSSIIYKVADLLNEDDPQTRNFVSGILMNLGEEVVDPLKKYLDLELSKSDNIKTSLFYVIDILSDLNVRSIIPVLHKMLNKCSSEEQQLFVYEALSKLGEGDIVLPVVEEFAKDDNLEDFADLIIMIFGHIVDSRSFNNLAKLYDEPTFQHSKSLILDAARNIVVNMNDFSKIDRECRLFKEISNDSK
jgi:predicted house-cleaning noncanonical NTP pyrophosphatase (MazG superfamily)